MNSIQPDRAKTSPRRHHISLALAAMNLMAAAGTAIYLSVRFGMDLTGQPLAQASVLFAGGLVLVDLAWLVVLLAGKSMIPFETGLSRFMVLKALSRPQSLTAWLIYHSAEIPLLVLGARSGTMQVPQYLAYLGAVLVMGLLPVGLIIWLDVYLARKLRR
ncbi:MAG: hypothetical protein PHQ83_00040 [Eubacteriales bacterium]|nr:hypothetical protein [Eubacteriales bacterium]